MGNRQLPYIQAYTVCIIGNSILYFGVIHDSKQANVEQLQWNKLHLFPLWSRFSYFVGLVCVNCANG